ncbi:MAG: hypothetical protein ACTSQJ_07240 [Promethearchaeota archaeon]
MRKFTLNRWNWSEKAGKWVYVSEKNGKRRYSYQLEPPKEFMSLMDHFAKLNEKLMNTNNPDENTTIFKELMKITKRMQAMRKGE